MTITLGNIRIDRIDDGIKVTIDADPFLTPYLDGVEATGETLEEALSNLLEFVEAYG